jgi:hypothetical protein
MSKLVVTIGGVDYSYALTEYQRVVDLCTIMDQAILTFLPDIGNFNPYTEVTVDYVGERRFTGYVSSTRVSRSKDSFRFQVTCDNRSIKRLNDYWFEFDVGTWTTYYLGVTETCKNFMLRVCGPKIGRAHV